MKKLKGFKLTYADGKDSEKTIAMSDSLSPDFFGTFVEPEEMWQPYPKGEWRLIKMTFTHDFFVLVSEKLFLNLRDSVCSFKANSKNVKYWFMDGNGEWYGGEGLYLSEMDVYVTTDDVMRIRFKWEADGHPLKGQNLQR